MDSPHGAAVRAEGFGLKGPRGWAFRKVDVEAGPGSLIAIEGPSGSGRTCLLLALTGRMKPAEGHAEVGGLRLPRRMAAVRRISALGPVPGVSDLDPALTVTEHLRERALMQRRFDGSLRALLRPPGERAAAARARIDEALGGVGLDVEALPKAGRTAVRDLERLEALRLSVALALVGRPRLLAVDDADLKLSEAERAEAWELFRGIAARGTTVLMVCTEAPEDAVVVRTVTGTARPAGADVPDDGTADGDARVTGSGDGAEDADRDGAPQPSATGKGTSPETADGADGADGETVPGAEGAGTTAGAGTGTTGGAGPAVSGDASKDTGTSAGTAPDVDRSTRARTGTAVDTGAGTRAHDTETRNETEEGAADALAETGRA